MKRKKNTSQCRTKIFIIPLSTALISRSTAFSLNNGDIKNWENLKTKKRTASQPILDQTS